jgi:hypothetical protein
MIEEALCYTASVWVIISWAKIWIKPTAPIQKYLCAKCITFWITLAFTWNPFTASVASLIAMGIDTYQNNIKITL